MGMKEDNDEVTTKTRILSLELLQVNFYEFICAFLCIFDWLIGLMHWIVILLGV